MRKRKKKRIRYDRCSICNEEIMSNYKDTNTYDLCFDCHQSVEDAGRAFEEIPTDAEALWDDDWYEENKVLDKYTYHMGF